MLDEEAVSGGEHAELRRALDGLAELAEKYRLLVALRRAPPGRTDARRDAMRAIAARFPGALREGDDAPLDELVRRRDAVDALGADLRARGPAALPRLLAPQHDFARFGLAVHARLRAALDARRRDPRPARAASADGSGGGDARRLSERVYREVAREAGVPVEALKAALFPHTPPAARAEDPRP